MPAVAPVTRAVVVMPTTVAGRYVWPITPRGTPTPKRKLQLGREP
jgi:hypothetical protein